MGLLHLGCVLGGYNVAVTLGLRACSRLGTTRGIMSLPSASAGCMSAKTISAWCSLAVTSATPSGRTTWG